LKKRPDVCRIRLRVAYWLACAVLNWLRFVAIQIFYEFPNFAYCRRFLFFEKLGEFLEV
jgi:hypothetical protein